MYEKYLVVIPLENEGVTVKKDQGCEVCLLHLRQELQF